ncbi:MAG: glycosyltransferase [Alphaproteobacteria bacterium GM202ARS2]|nr:glycosyltransferase [Alphaproteobacteria bacterium GM202ARS2]
MTRTSPPEKTPSHNTPKVSVIIATYNRAYLLPHAIRSIISQTLTDWELIIVDDASTDNTLDVINAFTTADPRIRYYRHDHNQGPYRMTMIFRSRTACKHRQIFSTKIPTSTLSAVPFNTLPPTASNVRHPTHSGYPIKPPLLLFPTSQPYPSTRHA